MTKPLVSVIVTTKNSAKTLAQCLASIKKQTYNNIELIIIDNHSKDSTTRIAKKYTKNVYIKGNERSSQRNYGAKKSNGKFLLFIDSDMTLSPRVVENCVTKFNYKDVKGLYIPEKILGNSYFAKIRNFERSFYNGTVIDAVRFVTKKGFDSIGGFDEKLIAGEDWDFDKRIRKLGKTAIIDVPLYHDESKVTFGDYFHKKKYYSKELSKYINKWGKGDVDIKKQFGVPYRFLLVFVEKGKWKQILKHPLLFIGIILLKIIIGFVFIFQNN